LPKRLCAKNTVFAIKGATGETAVDQRSNPESLPLAPYQQAGSGEKVCGKIKEKKGVGEKLIRGQTGGS